MVGVAVALAGVTLAVALGGRGIVCPHRRETRYSGKAASSVPGRLTTTSCL